MNPGDLKLYIGKIDKQCWIMLLINDEACDILFKKRWKTIFSACCSNDLNERISYPGLTNKALFSVVLFGLCVSLQNQKKRNKGRQANVMCPICWGGLSLQN